jgi:hypothetical protein
MEECSWKCCITEEYIVANLLTSLTPSDILDADDSSVKSEEEAIGKGDNSSGDDKGDDSSGDDKGGDSSGDDKGDDSSGDGIDGLFNSCIPFRKKSDSFPSVCIISKLICSYMYKLINQVTNHM